MLHIKHKVIALQVSDLAFFFFFFIQTALSIKPINWSLTVPSLPQVGKHYHKSLAASQWRKRWSMDIPLNLHIPHQSIIVITHFLKLYFVKILPFVAMKLDCYMFDDSLYLLSKLIFVMCSGKRHFCLHYFLFMSCSHLTSLKIVIFLLKF